MQSSPQNYEEVNPIPYLTFDQKRRQQQDDAQENKKQKYHENIDLPTIAEHLLPQSIALPDHISVPTDSSLQAPMTPTPPQTISPPQTIEPALTELTHDNPDQDVTWTHGLEHHSMTMTDPPSEPPPQEPEASTTSHLTSLQFPDNWSQMSRRARKSWIQSHKTNHQLD